MRKKGKRKKTKLPEITIVNWYRMVNWLVKWDWIFDFLLLLLLLFLKRYIQKKNSFFFFFRLHILFYPVVFGITHHDWISNVKQINVCFVRLKRILNTFTGSFKSSYKYTHIPIEISNRMHQRIEIEHVHMVYASFGILSMNICLLSLLSGFSLWFLFSISSIDNCLVSVLSVKELENEKKKKVEYKMCFTRYLLRKICEWTIWKFLFCCCFLWSSFSIWDKTFGMNIIISVHEKWKNQETVTNREKWVWAIYKTRKCPQTNRI